MRGNTKAKAEKERIYALISLSVLFIFFAVFSAVVKADSFPVTIETGLPATMTAGESYTATVKVFNDAAVDNHITWNFTLSRIDPIDPSEFALSSTFTTVQNPQPQDIFVANCTQSPTATWNCLNGTEMFTLSPFQAAWISLNVTLHPATSPGQINHSLTVAGDHPLQVTPQPPSDGGGSQEGGGDGTYFGCKKEFYICTERSECCGGLTCEQGICKQPTFVNNTEQAGNQPPPGTSG